MSPNESNEELESNGRDLYEFQLDEENNRYNEHVPSIARCMDGTNFLNSENILSEKRKCLHGDSRGQWDNGLQWWNLRIE